MKAETNYIYIGREDRLTQWAGIAEKVDEPKELAEEHEPKLVAKIKKLIKKVLGREDINSSEEGVATMESFNGNN